MIPKKKIAEIFRKADLELTSLASDEVEDIIAEYEFEKTNAEKLSERRRIAKELKKPLQMWEKGFPNLIVPAPDSLEAVIYLNLKAVRFNLI